MGAGTANVASPLGRRRAELRAQLTLVARPLSVESAADTKLLAELTPILDAGVKAQVRRLDTLPAGVEEQWAILSDVGSKAQRLASDALAFVGGVAARRLQLDRGACDVADTLLRTIATTLRVNREFVTLPASSEYIDVMSEVIRIRYPGGGIWDLPVALHEFGHYLVPRVGVTQGTPVRAIIERERGKRPNLGSFSEELWCDVFATYVGGPAYGFSLAARLDPTTTHRDAKPTHPSPAKRVVAVLVTIDALQAAWRQKERVAGSLQSLRDGVAGFWAERVESARQVVEPTDAETTYATELGGEFVSILDRDERCLNARFDDGSRAEEVAAALEQGEALAPDRSLLDLVNGGWVARRTKERAGRADEVDRIAKDVTSACAKIAGGGVR